MSRADRLEAEAAVLRAEEEFVAKKKAGTVTSEDKQTLRALRQAYRSGDRPPVKDGVTVGTVGSKVEVE